MHLEAHFSQFTIISTANRSHPPENPERMVGLDWFSTLEADPKTTHRKLSAFSIDLASPSRSVQSGWGFQSENRRHQTLFTIDIMSLVYQSRSILIFLKLLKSVPRKHPTT